MINKPYQIPFILDKGKRLQSFPNPCHALSEPNGLLAIGGQLSTQQLLEAYKSGVFPWFNQNDPILWWSPSPRALLYPSQFKCSRTMKKELKKDILITFDLEFNRVIRYCSDLRKKEGTWITSEMLRAYEDLHEQGIAHSIEVWHKKKLVGGLYGLSMGKVFFGESMFHLKPNASKIALFSLCHLPSPLDFDFIDCQIPSNHLYSLGAIDCSRSQYLKQLKTSLLSNPTIEEPWLIPPLNGIDLLNIANKHLRN